MGDPRTKDLFQDLLEVPRNERAAWLDGACGDDEGLRARVANLLAAHDRAGNFLEAPATWLGEALASPGEPTERRGEQIGAFELLERLGEGGFGTVWRAKQTRPVAREVALKIVKRGMDTDEVIRRFELERDALARMDHPHVAKVLEAGATPDGRPWFAMELVDGEPITEYGDRRGLDVRARLRLFVDVCRAIQHAHHKGLVHRDVKPTNVLVATRDGRPVPRVIDFGIAKAIDRAAAEHTVFTTERRLLGTPEYMSPEQVETWGADVDARTDVYSLGVLLYELVTGSRPFDLRRIGQGRFDEVLRLIREQDPERPSSRIAALSDQEAGEVAAARRTAVGELRRQVRGDVDWIVMRALEKDRQRRYATPEQLAADVERCLRDEPVTAGPPDLGYRLGKLARRHRGAFALLGVAALSLVAGTGFAVQGMWTARQAEQAEREARERAQRGEEDARLEAARVRLALDAVEDLMTSADPRTTHGPGYTVHQMLDDFAARLGERPPADPLVEARIRAVLGRTYRQLGELDHAEVHLLRALELHERELGADHVEVAESRSDVAWLLHDRGRYDEAVARIEPVIAFWRGRPDDAVELAHELDALAGFLSQAGRHEDALAAIEEAVALCEAHLEPGHADTVRCLAERAVCRFRAGRIAGARRELQEARLALRAHVPPDHPELLSLEHNLGVALHTEGRLSDAESRIRHALEGRRRVFGERHAAVASSELALGWVLQEQGAHADAIPLLTQARDTFVATSGDDHPDVARCQLRLGEVLSAVGRHDEAIATLLDAIDRLRSGPAAPAAELAAARSNLAVARFRSGDSAAAVAELRAAIDEAAQGLPEHHPTRVGMLANLAHVLHEQGDLDGAVEAIDGALAEARALWEPGHRKVRMIESIRDRIRR